ncbi:MAG TPA: hypothetical protein VL400_01390 [Polyangiaceae bacterium]|jgi:hypothetical protein|nr:hypothetical protein [Polyangiaceae bacterium]
MFRRALAVVFAVTTAGALAGCIPPQSPVEKLTDNAYDVVMAARFGRMDIVTSMVQPTAREDYVASHAEWGGKVRILDIEYGGMKLVKSDKAIVAMTVSWQRLDESMLQTTALAQTWKNTDQGWQIESEVVAGGDKGLLLLPEPKPKKSKGGRPDASDATAQTDAASTELARSR